MGKFLENALGLNVRFFTERLSEEFLRGAKWLEQAEQNPPRLSSAQDQNKLKQILGPVSKAGRPDDREFDKLKSDPTRQEKVTQPLSGPGDINVNQHQYHVASDEISLATSSLATCSALIVVDPKQHTQFLGHVDVFTKVPEISDAVRKNLPQLSDAASIFIVKGSMKSETEKNIYLAMKSLGYADKVKFVETGRGDQARAVAVQHGKLFTYDLGMNGGAFSNKPFGGTAK